MNETMEVKDNENLGLKTIIVEYALQWKIFAVAAFVSLILAILYLTLYPRTYEMMAYVQLQDENDLGGAGFGLGEAAGLMKSFGLGSVSSGGIIIEDEVLTLQTNKLFSEMISKLDIYADYTKPMSFFRIYNPPVIISTDSLTHIKLDEVIQFKIDLSGSKIKVQAKSDRTGKRKFEFASLPAEMLLDHGTFKLDYNTSNQGKDNSIKKINVDFRPVNWAAEDILEQFNIEDYSKSSQIIEVSCIDHERTRGLDMLNTLIACYNENNSVFKQLEAHKTLAFLDGRIDSLTSSLKHVEADIALYKHSNKLTDIQYDAQFYAEQMKEIQIKMIELEAQSHVIHMMDEFVREPDNKYNLVPSLLSQDGEKSVVASYNELLIERARIIQNSDISNPLVTTITEQIDQLRNSVYLSISNAEKANQLTIQNIRDKEKELFAKMESYPEQERNYIELRRQQEILQGIYLLLLQKREETALSIGVDRDRAKIIETPYVKSKPVGPRKLFAAIGMLLFTLIIPVIFIFCREQIVVLVNQYKEVKKQSSCS